MCRRAFVAAAALRVFGGPSTSIINSRDAVPAELQKNLYGVQPCDPNNDSRQYVKDWAKRYKDTYNEVADYSSPSVYEGVFLLKAAVEKANSLDHAVIATPSRRSRCVLIVITDDNCTLRCSDTR